MSARHGRVWLGHAVRFASFGAASSLALCALPAQAPHPFGPPVCAPTFTLGGIAALVDVDRDGSQDVLVPGLFGGTLTTALDEDGNALAANLAGPAATGAPGVPVSPIVAALATGCFDDDARSDLVTVTNAGSVHLHRNLGGQRLGRAHFAPDTCIDTIAPLYPINPPFTTYSFPCTRAVDYDLDGNCDVLLAGARIDRWSALTQPGFVVLWLGDGSGGFTAVHHVFPGNVVDAEIADLDNNGTHDHLVVLTETGGVGAFGYDLHHLELVGNQWVASNVPQFLGGGRFTDLALADVVGDANLDYVLASTWMNLNTTTGSVAWYQGDGLGNVQTAGSGTFWLPGNTTMLSDYVAAVVAGDWNRDGHVDLAVLRGYVQVQAAASTTPGTFGDSELLVAMGPMVTQSTFTPIALPGYHVFASTQTTNFAMLPIASAPTLLRTIDLRGDSSPDLMVAGLRTPTGPTPTAVVTLANATPAAAGDAGFTKVGAPSGGVAQFPARLGFDGGRPQPGNRNFACTLLNVQGGCLCGLMWSPIAQANWMSVHGLTLHLVPVEFGWAAITSGSQAGEGFHSYPLPIPNLAALVGDAGYFQFNYYDHVSGAFGGTQATGVRIGL
jgi:hypothetical protein